MFLFLQPFLFQSVTSQQGISLNSLSNDQLVVRPGENITLQCITRGSSILAWSGTNYIDSRVEFVVYDQIGTTYTPNAYTTAVLVNAYTDRNGQFVIESYLNITGQSSIPSSSITCHNVGTGETKAISFQTSSKHA